MNALWNDVLVQPLLDFLLLLYHTVAFGNLGVAVIELTILLRLALLPLNILAEKNTARDERLEFEVADIQKRYKDDPVLINEQIRDLFKKRRVRPWAKTLIFIAQLIVLVALYQVFQRGIGARLATPVNATFLGFELGHRNLFWACLVGFILYLEISYEQRKLEHLLHKPDAVYRYAFPVFSIVVLSLLPMVKSLFVLTSMAFSLTVSTLRRWLWPTASIK